MKLSMLLCSLLVACGGTTGTVENHPNEAGVVEFNLPYTAAPFVKFHTPTLPVDASTEDANQSDAHSCHYDAAKCDGDKCDDDDDDNHHY